MSASDELLARYERSLIGVFGVPQLVLTRGDGCYVWDADGRRYLDLLGGIAVNALGHNHPSLVVAVSTQASEMLHLSNFFTSPAQVGLAERILEIADAPAGSGVFFCNSGAEAIEAAIKMSRRTGRTRLVAASGSFHGRTTGALALTSKETYRSPFEPLIPGVDFVPFGDVDALRRVVDDHTAAIFLEPIQGEGGVVPATSAYLLAAREVADATGALLVLDEIQTGVARTGDWFAFQHVPGLRPDVMTLAKGLGGGIPVGAVVAFGEHVRGLLTPGQHGTTFGGNPLAAAAGLAVLDEIERAGLLEHARAVGDHVASAIRALGHPSVTDVRGRGLLRAIALDAEIAPALVTAARDQGFIVNAVTPSAIRIAPPLIITAEQLDTFVTALPGLVDEAHARTAQTA
ncbi:acetylornithine transaminase [Nostocoides sp. F2B08]|uniref:acetylornithine transaminase n=1 Tax=Nostocoides sp. F2B08 TaxID=2653936 RepID=UPI001263BF3B|nr:acetylornithine transaminase [Tetrasphaera sp. F2B08]KAB7744639.1 acetylornithine transaminase [Tetrasphaera sp. F2B08]